MYPSQRVYPLGQVGGLVEGEGERINMAMEIHPAMELL
jgi:hypothetical protein